MAKSIYVLFCIVLLATIATTQIIPEDTCSPWLGYCRVYEDCCRHLECSFYTAKCVPISGPKIPGRDKRPIGPPPYPPM